MSLAIFSPTPYINKWQMSLCNNSSDNKSYWIHRVDVKVSAQVTTVTYMHQSQPSLHSLRKHFTVHLELWPGNHFIWCNATLRSCAHSRNWHWPIFVIRGNFIVNTRTRAILGFLFDDHYIAYTLLHEHFRRFFSNIIGLPEHRNKRKSVLEITKMYYF